MALHDVILDTVTIQYEGDGILEFEEALKADKNDEFKNLNAYLKCNGAEIDYKAHSIVLTDLGNQMLFGGEDERYFAKFPYSFFKPLMKKYPGLAFIFDTEFNALSLGQNVVGRFFCVYENDECVFNAGKYVLGVEWVQENWYEYIDEDEEPDWENMRIELDEIGRAHV